MLASASLRFAIGSASSGVIISFRRNIWLHIWIRIHFWNERWWCYSTVWKYISEHRQYFLFLRACSYEQKLSWLVRKVFDVFTSEISPWYENNMKSYTAFIWDKKFPRVPRSRLSTSEISPVNKRDLGDRDVFPIVIEHNFPRLSGITFCRVRNFSIQFMFSTMSQPETLPSKRDNVSPYEQNKSIWLVEKFSR
jgi:hypothetical protein